jgi:tRNA (guanine-N7-)-methyltransferase
MRESGRSFFGRRKGKTLKPSQQTALRTVLPELLLDISSPAPPDLPALFAAPVDDVRLEIGFGGGEHLLHEAARFPRTGFIGVEPFQNSLAKAVASIAEGGIRNIRLYDDDAAFLLDWIPAGALARIDLLYPDPWPKSRHWKRRFVNQENLGRITRALRPGGAFRFASDVPGYVNWTIREVAEHGGLRWTAESVAACRERWEGWPGTRYEAKALREGRAPAYLSFVKPD